MRQILASVETNNEKQTFDIIYFKGEKQEEEQADIKKKNPRCMSELKHSADTKRKEWPWTFLS